MPTPTEQLLSRTSYAGDGVTTAWSFTFASGYIDKAHVKAFTTDGSNVRTDLTVVAGDFIGEFQLSIVPPVPVGHELTIYRDTPKDAPLVDFADGGNLTEAALDTLAKQAVFAAAESLDALTEITGPALGEAVVAAAASAAAAAVSAGQAAASAVSVGDAAATAAANAAALTAASLVASMSIYVSMATAAQVVAEQAAAKAEAEADDATVSATAADADRVQAQTAAATASAIAASLSGSFGFTNAAYDFGFVTDTATYLDLDCGTLP